MTGEYRDLMNKRRRESYARKNSKKALKDHIPDFDPSDIGQSAVPASNSNLAGMLVLLHFFYSHE